MTHKNAAYYSEKLGLTPHVEGGSFSESYKSSGEIPQRVLSAAFNGNRAYSTAIYFLLEFGQFSAFHKIASDELWHFYAGDPLTLYVLEADGNLLTHTLGSNLDAGERFQCVVNAGTWFGSRCEVVGGFSLVGCTVAPGFDYADFAIANKQALLHEYPQHSQLVEALCRN